MSAGEIIAGNASIQIGVDDSGVMQGLSRLQDRLQNFSSNMSVIGGGFAAVGGGIDAFFTNAVHQSVAYGAAINDMSARTGMATEFLTGMKYAAEQNGTSLQAVIIAARTMAMQLDRVTQTGKDTSGVFARLGVNAKELKDLKPEERFMKISEALGKIADPGEKAALAQKIFGRSAQQLLPILGDVEKMKGYMLESQRLGISLTKEEAAQLDELDDAWTTVKAANMGLSTAIAMALTPALVDLQTVLANGIIIIKDLAKEYDYLIPYIAGAATVVAAVGVAFVTAGLGAMWFNSVLAMLTTVVPLLMKSFSVILGPAGLVGIIALAAVSILDGFGIIDVGLWDMIESFRIGGISIGEYLGMGWLYAEMKWYEFKSAILYGLQQLVQGFVDAINKIIELYNAAAEEMGGTKLGLIGEDKSREAKEKRAEALRVERNLLAQEIQQEKDGTSPLKGVTPEMIASSEQEFQAISEEYGKLIMELNAKPKASIFGDALVESDKAAETAHKAYELANKEAVAHDGSSPVSSGSLIDKMLGSFAGLKKKLMEPFGKFGEAGGDGEGKDGSLKPAEGTPTQKAMLQFGGLGFTSSLAQTWDEANKKAQIDISKSQLEEQKKSNEYLKNLANQAIADAGSESGAVYAED